MKLFGLEITRAPREKYLSGSPRGGWWPVWPIVREPYAGAWQRNAETCRESVLSFFAVYACMTLIAGDIAKMRLKLIEWNDTDEIWEEIDSAAFSPVIREPNRFQTRVKFYEWWTVSKLIHGNTYALKQRDNRNVVTALYILDPCRVRPLVAPDGAIFYELSIDNLAGLTQAINVPQREIIHDTMCPLFHPLCGVSPLFAAAKAALQGLAIQDNSEQFFSNGATPGGVLTAPGSISSDTAQRAKDYWETNFGGNNSGRVAVLGDGLKYEAMTMKSSDAQLIEQLRFTAEMVCSVFHVPPYMIGIKDPPAFNNIEAFTQAYYSQGVQTLLEALEAVLAKGLELDPTKRGVEFNKDDLLRMDTAAQMATAKEGVGGGILAPNEARQQFNRRKLPGGDTAYLQQQYFSLDALNKRDTAPSPTIPAPTPSPKLPAPEKAAEIDEQALIDEWQRRTARYSRVA